MLYGLGWVLEAEAELAVPLGYCGHRAFRGGGRSWWEGRQQDVFPPPLSSPVLLRPLTEALLSARQRVDTICINKIPFWPVCIPASAKSWFEAGSDKIWLSRERAKTG